MAIKVLDGCTRTGQGEAIVDAPAGAEGPSGSGLKNHLALAVAATIFFVPPMGFVAWKAAARVDERLAAGDASGAAAASRKAARWAWASIGLGAVLYLVLFTVLYYQLKALGLGLRALWPSL